MVNCGNWKKNPAVCAAKIFHRAVLTFLDEAARLDAVKSIATLFEAVRSLTEMQLIIAAPENIRPEKGHNAQTGTVRSSIIAGTCVHVVGLREGFGQPGASTPAPEATASEPVDGKRRTTREEEWD